jgi:uncharacterized membrane protein
MIVTLNNKNAKRQYGLTETVTSTGLNSSYYKKGAGFAYVFDVDGFKVVKNVYYSGKVNYIVSGKNIAEDVYLDVLDMSKIKKINEKLRLNIISDIMSSDLTRVKKIMTENKEGFTFFMETLINKGLSKDLAFASVVKDYYSNHFHHPIDTKAIIKVMIKYGYKFTSMAEADKLIR